MDNNAGGSRKTLMEADYILVVRELSVFASLPFPEKKIIKNCLIYLN